MAKQRRTRRGSPRAAAAGTAAAAGRSPLRAAARPIAWSALVSSVVLTIAVGPAHAAPADDDRSAIPDTGLRPAPAGALQLPGGVTTSAAPQLSSLAEQITAKQTQLEQTGERLKQLNLEHATARTNLALADHAWRAASDRLKQAEERADTDAPKAYKATVGLPSTITSDLRGFGALSPLTGDDIPAGFARELTIARQDERTKYQAYTTAMRAEESVANQYLALQADFERQEQEYLALRQRNADQLAAIEREREARDQSIGAQYIDNDALNGFTANQRALDAVDMALKQLGDPYVWAAEGPDSFDCSGLMWYSYFHGPKPGYSLPRVAKDQYNGTRSRTVSRFALLPGDLLFFATNPNDWTTVHHVGMYLGNGKMIHAPHTGDVVKISTVWWSEFFAATRVFPEVVSSPVGTGPTPPPSSGGGHPSPSPSQTSGPPSSPPPTTTSPTSPPPTTTSPPPDSSSPLPPDTTPSDSASPSPTGSSLSFEPTTPESSAPPSSPPQSGSPGS